MKKITNKLNICLMFGGKSVEHDISILSGLQVYHALDKSKYNIEVVYITKNNEMLIGKDLTNIKTYKTFDNNKKYRKIHIENINNKTYLVSKKIKKQIDVFIPVVHGEGVEDGTISAILEFNDSTYINTKMISSGIAQDKIFTKNILEKYQILTPKYIAINDSNKIEEHINNIKNKLSFPIIIKSARLGSSIGIEKVTNKDELEEKLKQVFKYSERIIVEELIENIKEYNCACFKYNDNIYISSIEEIKSNSEFLTFDEKYISKEIKTNDEKCRIIPANINKELEKQIKEKTKDIYQILDMNGVIRIDYIYDILKDVLYFNEINTIPGSLAFYLFENTEIKFNILLDMLIKEAILNKRKLDDKIKTFSSNVLSSKSNKLTK